jgi:hypothetical protein
MVCPSSRFSDCHMFEYLDTIDSNSDFILESDANNTNE